MVRLLKEINRRLGEGSLPTSLFYQLNTHLLELMPEPARRPDRLVEAARRLLGKGRTLQGR